MGFWPATSAISVIGLSKQTLLIQCVHHLHSFTTNVHHLKEDKNTSFHLESLWKHPQQLHPNGQANQRCHAAVWNGGCEEHTDSASCIIHLDVCLLQHIQLLQSPGVLRVVDVLYHVYACEDGGGRSEGEGEGGWVWGGVLK